MLQLFQRWFKLRFAILYPFGIIVVLFAMPDDRSIWQGIGLIVAGLLTRVWANGYAIKMDRLTTSGPYAFIRHPLYAGTILIVAGFVILLKFYYAGIPFLVLLFLIYRSTAQKEERMLEEKFKDVYRDYRSSVPALFPRLTPFRKGEKWPFSFRRLLNSEEYKLFLWVLVLVIVFHLKHEFIGEREKPDAKIISLIILAFLLGISDLIADFIRKKLKAKLKHG